RALSIFGDDVVHETFPVRLQNAERLIESERTRHAEADCALAVAGVCGERDDLALIEAGMQDGLQVGHSVRHIEASADDDARRGVRELVDVRIVVWAARRSIT